VNGFVKFLKSISGVIVLDVSSELSLVLLVILFFEVLHVLTNVSSEDSLLVHLGVVFLGVSVVSRESLLRVWDVKSSVSGSLEGSEDSGTSGGGLGSNIQQTSERFLLVVDFSNEVLLLVVLSGDDVSIDFSVSFVGLIKSNLLQQSSGAQKTSGISSGVVLKSDFKSVSAEFGRGGLAHNSITIDHGVSDLADNELVGESDDESVLRGLVLGLVLSAQSLSLSVVGLSLASSAVLGLESGEVGLVLKDLDESAVLGLNVEREGGRGVLEA